MKAGDLVRIVNTEIILLKDEPDVGIYLHDDINMIMEDWGEQVAGECDCVVFWNEDCIPFRKTDLVVLREEF